MIMQTAAVLLALLAHLIPGQQHAVPSGLHSASEHLQGLKEAGKESRLQKLDEKTGSSKQLGALAQHTRFPLKVFARLLLLPEFRAAFITSGPHLVGVHANVLARPRQPCILDRPPVMHTSDEEEGQRLDEAEESNITEHYHNLLRLERVVSGPEHPDTIKALTECAQVYMHQGLEAEAASLNKELLDVRSRVFGPEHPDTLKVMNNYAMMLAAVGNHSEAEPLIKEVLELSRRIMGPDDEFTMKALDNCRFIIARLRGRETEYKLLTKMLFDQRLKVLGEEHPDTLKALDEYAISAYRTGLKAETSEVMHSRYNIKKRVFGEKHPDTLGSLADVTHILKERGFEEEALPLMKKLAELSREVRGPAHADTLRALGNYADAVFKRGNHTETEPLAKELFELRRAVLGAQHAGTIQALNMYANVLTALGREEEAEPLMREALALNRRVKGTEHPDTIQALSNYAFILDHCGRVSEAEPYMKELVPLTSQVLGPDHPDTLEALADYVRTLHKLGRVEEAETLINERRPPRNPNSKLRIQIRGPQDASAASASPDSPKRAVTYTLQAVLESSQQQSESGMKPAATEKVAEREPTQIKPFHLRLQAFIVLLRTAFTDVFSKLKRRFYALAPKQKRNSNALQDRRLREIERLKAVLQLERAALGREHPETLEALSKYANALVACGCDAEAEPLLREALETSRRVLGPEHPDTLMFSRHHDKVRRKGLLRRLFDILLAVPHFLRLKQIRA